MWKKVLIALVLLLVIGFFAVGNYFYDYAVDSEKNIFSKDDNELEKKLPQEEAKALKWYQAARGQEVWQLTSRDGLALSAYFVPAEHSRGKTAILAHGYGGSSQSLSLLAHMFHEMGYDVLAPDARGHGKSSGKYVGFGWDERLDYLAWIQRVLEKHGPDETIILWGISMGAATVMMTSGEKLPNNVRAIIEDCGYSSAKEELAYQLKKRFKLPPFPFLPAVNAVTKIRAGYSLNDADAVKQLKKNRTPMLFIHGEADDFVPFWMLDEVYQATSAPKEKYAVPGAKHAAAYQKDPEKYRQTVAVFLQKYAD